MASRSDVEAGKAHVRLYLRGNELIRGLDNLQRRMVRIGADLQQIGQRFASFGAPIAGAIGFGIKQFADFDDQMQIVKAVTGASAEEFAKLTASARRLGETTAYSATEVAGIMGELGKAGFAADQIDTMTESVLNLAKATATEPVLTSGIMAATLRQFGLAAEDAASTADMLTIAANASFNSVESLGESLGYAGPVAASFGLSLKETLAILGGLGNVGIQGSEAGTALRRLLTLSGAEAKKLKDVLGVSFTDAAGNIRPLVDVLAEVNTKTAGLSSGVRAAKFNEAFGLLGITSATVIGKSAADIDALRKALDESTGAAAAAADEMSKGLGEQLKKALSAANAVALSMGESLKPQIVEVLERFKTFAAEIRSWVDGHPRMVTAAIAIAAGITGIGFALIAAGSMFSVFSATISLALIPLKLIVGAAAALLSPLGLITAGLIAGVTAWVQYTESGRQAFEAVKAYLATYLGTIMSAFEGIRAALANDDLGTAAAIAWAGIKVIFAQGVRDLMGLMNETLGAFIWKLFTGDFTGAFEMGLNAINVVWKLQLVQMAEAFKFVMQPVLDFFDGFSDRIIDVLKKLNEFHVPGAELALKSAQALQKLGGKFGVAPADLSAKLDSLATNARESAVSAIGDLTKSAGPGGAVPADDFLRRSQEELAKLVAEAKSASPAAVKEAAKEAAKASKPGAAGVPTGVAASLATAGQTATFSAIQLAGAGSGSMAERTLEEIRGLRKSAEKNEAAAKEMRDVLVKLPFALTTLVPRFG